MDNKDLNLSYTTEDYRKDVDLKDFIKNCVDVERIKNFCKSCPRYCKVWSCPEHSFDPLLYWKTFSSFTLILRKIILPPELTGRVFTPEEQAYIYEKVFFAERKNFSNMLRGEETDKSISLHVGGCDLCGEANCARREGKPCRFPKKRRYSIESLGGDVVKTSELYFNMPLLWPKDGRLPEYLMLVGGLLYL